MITLVSTAEAGERLGISMRQAQRLARDGRLGRVGIDRIDYASVLHLMSERRGDHHRAWSEKTAWAAVALLSGIETDWLGQAQRSRLKKSLRSMTGADVARRARNRATIHRLRGHSAVVRRLATEVTQTGSESDIGGLAAVASRLDGYVDASHINHLIGTYRLEDDWDGDITLRSTSFDIEKVRRVADESRVLAAVDLAGSLDTRERSAGLAILDTTLERLGG
jgi:hypothetical protein